MMPSKSHSLTALALSLLLATGCVSSQKPAATVPGTGSDIPVVETAELSVALVGILSAGDGDSLVKAEGWHEFVLEIENRSQGLLTVKNAKLLNADGRYVDSASRYAQIVAPPDPGEKVAGHVARSASGIAVGQVIPFGGLITSTIFRTASAYGGSEKTKAKRVFYLRVLKNVELAPGGKVRASAYLPALPNARQLVVESVLEGGEKRAVQIPLSPTGP